MLMHNNPPHPGETIRELVLEPLGLSVSDAANALGVTRQNLNELLRGRRGITPRMAVRLSKATDTTPESWLMQQLQYYLWQEVQHADEIHVKKLVE